MSFDLFVGCFRNGMIGQFRRQLLEKHFSRYVSVREPNCLTLDFGKGGTAYLYCGREDLIEGFNINRPVSAPEFYDALFDIMSSESLALYVPGECPPLVASATIAAQLPADMVETLGQPVVLGAGSEIQEWIAKA
jgi:hypothetical protein